MPLEADEKDILAILRPNKYKSDICASIGPEDVRRSLAGPIGTKRLKDIVKHGEKVAIITSDITRPVPSKAILPPLLDELSEAGAAPDDIMIVFALGNHRKHTDEEKRYLVGDDIFNKYTCLDSDQTDTVSLGKTSAGTPVDIFRTVASADRRICIGNIEYHYFAGYSGGLKAIMPGVSTRSAIQSNHSMMIDDNACAGRILDNPVRADLEEVTKFLPVDFIVNVVLDEKKRILRAFAGHCIDAHRQGCKFLDSIYQVPLDRPADVVIVSAGGYPKDINIYQAQKALDNAKTAVRGGGVIILAAECAEGYGEKVFERWFNDFTAPDVIISEIKRNFELGGHKAAAIAMVAEKCSIYLVSGMPSDKVEKMFMKPFDNLQDAYDHALESAGSQSSTVVIPFGGSTMPVVARSIKW